MTVKIRKLITVVLVVVATAVASSAVPDLIQNIASACDVANTSGCFP